jgi:uncharacterized protein YdiU (UPF0061 family)
MPRQTIELRDAPVAIVAECLDLLGTYEVDFTLFCRHLTRIAGGEDSKTLAAMFSSSEPFGKWFAKWHIALRRPGRIRSSRNATATGRNCPQNFLWHLARGWVSRM